MQIPGVGEIRDLHVKYAPSEEALDLVLTHCEIVWSIAEQLISVSGVDVDADVVRAGCLVHDIGVYRLYDHTGRVDQAHYVRHGVLGHEILEAEGFSEQLCRFCSCHTGMGLTRSDVAGQGLPLPPGDYVAVTNEERLVMYADKFHSKTTPPRFVTADSYAAYVARFGQDKRAAFHGMRRLFGVPDLGELAAVYSHAVT
ncbi:HD domain-containing protein [Streptomyces marianii]|uniref:HDIG domain-containing protein n=1 Tax=Streptomyces marianii TaxID=1817406 RepID=A0A5R9DWS9_9ACTN|nr:HD domain-containing protein [Streptomyces marianii]TLQ42101.1 HDIG domain-containing protein [Streptomyces marianii]